MPTSADGASSHQRRKSSRVQLSKAHILIALSFLIGLLCIRYIQSFDKHEKEPFRKMLLVTCWGGAWSIVITALLYMGLGYLGISGLKTSLGALLIIGPVEEFAKFMALLTSYFIYRSEFDEPADGIIYMSCVALGFSLIENFFYAMRPDSEYLLLLRLFISTPMHICFSAFMGLSFYLWRRDNRATGLLAISFILASLSHGTYNLIIFNGYALSALIVVVGVILSWTMDLLSYATALSPHRVPLKVFMAAYQKPESQQGIECLNCGSANPKLTYKQDRIIIQKCDGCDQYVTTRKSLYRIFQHYAATFKAISRSDLNKNNTDATLASLYAGNTLSKPKGIACFNLEALNTALEDRNNAIVEKMESKWWFPKRLYRHPPAADKNRSV
jgi:RsiW-degrading membrane proteinase PrsW (M82 family)